MFSAIMSSNMFSAPFSFSFSSPSKNPIMQMLVHLLSPQRSSKLSYFFFSFFFFLFCFSYFYYSVFNFCHFDYYVSRCVSPWVCSVWDSLCFLDLGGYFLSHVRDVFSYHVFKYVLCPFLFLLLFSF